LPHPCLQKLLSAGGGSSNAVVPKLVRAVTENKVAIMSYYPQYFAVIAHNTEQHCGFALPLWFRVTPEESHITPSLGTTAVMDWHSSNRSSESMKFIYNVPDLSTCLKGCSTADE